MELEHLTNENFDEVIKEKYVLVDFFATWCGPCRALGPVLQEVADELSGKCKVVKADVDELEDVARRYRIMSVPTMILFSEGEEVVKLMGYKPKEAILEEIVDFIK